jgi:hypothetical protein
MRLTLLFSRRHFQVSPLSRRSSRLRMLCFPDAFPAVETQTGALKRRSVRGSVFFLKGGRFTALPEKALCQPPPRALHILEAKIPRRPFFRRLPVV